MLTLEGAFVNDRRSYKKLLDAGICYNRNKTEKAHKILNSLKKKCVHSKDYAAVYNMQAVCLADEGLIDRAIVTYEKALQYDSVNALAWSNLGMLHWGMGKGKEAYFAYTNAIRYNPEDVEVNHNLAVFFLKAGEAEMALEHALKTISLNANITDAMYVASVAYQMLGDEEYAQKYCIMYGLNGGDAGGLKEKLASL